MSKEEIISKFGIEAYNTLNAFGALNNKYIITIKMNFSENPVSCSIGSRGDIFDGYTVETKVQLRENVFFQLPNRTFNSEENLASSI